MVIGFSEVAVVCANDEFAIQNVFRDSSKISETNRVSPTGKYRASIYAMQTVKMVSTYLPF